MEKPSALNYDAVKQALEKSCTELQADANRKAKFKRTGNLHGQNRHRQNRGRDLALGKLSSRQIPLRFN